MNPKVDIKSIGSSSAFRADERQAFDIFGMDEFTGAVAAFLLSPDLPFHSGIPQNVDNFFRENRKAHRKNSMGRERNLKACG